MTHNLDEGQPSRPMNDTVLIGRFEKTCDLTNSLSQWTKDGDDWINHHAGDGGNLCSNKIIDCGINMRCGGMQFASHK